MWDAVRNNPSRPSHRSAFTALYRDTSFITVTDLASDSVKLANMLPPDVQAIVGVARSGITPANIIATMLHLPLLAIRQTKGDVVQVGNGWRMGGSEHIGTDKKAKVAIIDDTSMTGNSFKAIKPIAEQHFEEYVTGCLYVNPLSNMKPDLWVHDLPWPHLLEWNLFNSVLSPNCAVDFDGILCHDCAGWQDDDGENYRGFIDNAVPKYVVRKAVVPMIVTARIEKYRERTQAWLDRHNIRCNRLVMHPAASLRERQRDDIAAFKARHFEAWAKSHHARPRPSMFIESDDNQAKRIAELTGRLVVCPSSAKCYGNAKS
jgi:orotate phosphoribosyltransferase